MHVYELSTLYFEIACVLKYCCTIPKSVYCNKAIGKYVREISCDELIHKCNLFYETLDYEIIILINYYYLSCTAWFYLRNGHSICADVIEDTIENYWNVAFGFFSFQTIWQLSWTFRHGRINTRYVRYWYII
jgi:hypothetical protein